MLFKGLRWRLVSQIQSNRMSLEDAQAKLAWDDSQNYIYEQMGTNTKLFDDVWEMRSSVFNMTKSCGEILEFGVYKGSSINYFADILTARSDTRSIVGFDSFSGFSEDWAGVDKVFTKSRFDLQGSLPDVRSNVQLINGFIEDTLPHFLEKTSLDGIAFLHIDTDTYTPSKVILSELKPYFTTGTIIIFDELLGYTNWRNHEFRALTEELSRSDYEFVAFGVGGKRANLVKAAIRIV